MDGTISGSVKSENGNKYFQINYPESIGASSGSWLGARFSLDDGVTNHIITNGVAVDFDFRWIGGGNTNNDITLVKLRRNRGSNVEALLLVASADSNGALVLKSNGNTLFTFPKQGAEGHISNFTNIRVEYYDVTATYSIFIGGICYIESMSLQNLQSIDLRGANFVTTTWDSDYMAVSRDNVSIAADNLSFEFARVNNGTKKNNYIFDFDNLYIKGIGPEEGRTYYYNNSFDNITLNGLSASATDMSYFYRGTASNVKLQSKNGNGYLSFGASARMDLRDTYQIIQDGNWTVSFKLQGTNGHSSMRNILRLHNRIDTIQFLQFDKEGNLYLGYNSENGTFQKIPGVKVPATGSNEWIDITVSCLVNNQNHTGEYTDFVAEKSAARRYTFILWVDGKLCGAITHTDGYFTRSEIYAGDDIAVNDMAYTLTALDKELTADELTAKGYALVEDTTSRKTYYNEKTYDYYQFQYENGAFKAGAFCDFNTTFSTSSVSLSAAESEAVLSDTNYTFSESSTKKVDTNGDKKEDKERRYDDYIHISTGEKVTRIFQRSLDADGNGTGDFVYHSTARYIVIPSYTNNDVLGFFDKDASAVTANIDDLKLYSGIGCLGYADDADDNEGVINEVEFANLGTDVTVSGVGTVDSAMGGRHGIVSSSNFVSSKVAVKSETVDGKTVKYVTLTADANDTYFGLNADYSGGKVFAADMTLRKVANVKSNFYLMRLRREGEKDTASVANDLLNYSADNKCVVFLIDGKTAYLCDAAGKKVALTDSKWTTLRAVVDETGSKPLVSFYVNGKLATYYTDDMLVPLKTHNLSGIVAESFSKHKNDIDQGVRFFQTDKSEVTMDLLTAKIEYAKATKDLVWSDSVALDFSEIKNVSELGEQFLISDGVYIENGELVIPAGETFGWVDYNGTFYNFQKTNGAEAGNKYRINDGYAFEMRIKAASSGSAQKGLLKHTGELMANNNMAYMQNGKLLMSKAISGYELNTLESDKYSDISILYTNNDIRCTVFADGKMVGMVGIADGAKTTNATRKEVAFTFADNIRMSELYIHRDQKRVLATNSGEIFELDPDTFLPADPKQSTYYPFASASGVMDSDTNVLRLYAAFLNDDEVGNYYSINMVENTSEIIADDPETVDVNEANHGVMIESQTWNDIVVTDYMEDKTTVYEYGLRFTPHKNARDDVSMTLMSIRRTDDGAPASVYKSEGILELFENGTLKFLGYTLCDSNSNAYKFDGSKWVNIAVIYDANTGKVSCIIDGTIPYYKNSSNKVIGLADKVQLSNARYYRMDAADTKIRFFNTASSSTLAVKALGKLDISGIKVYTINDTANVDFVGVQTDMSNNNIRLVAGADMLYYGRVGFDVEAFDENGNSIADTVKSYYTSTVYSSVDENVNGTSRKVYPEEYGYRYFYTANVMDVDQKNAVKLNVTPFSIVNGVKYPASTVTLDIDLRGAMDEWKVSADNSLEIKPEGDNISANFSTTDVVSYTNNGSLELNGLGAKFAFAADLKGGVVSVNLSNAKGEDSTSSLFDIYVDGKITQKDLKLDFGHHTVVLAEGLKGEHEFVIVKKSGGDYVCINNMSIYGKLVEAPELAVEDAVIVKVYDPDTYADKNNPHPEYRTVHVYTKTSDSSGKYYIRYQFTPLNDPLNDYNYITGPANSHHNAVMYRINRAHIVDRSSGSDTIVYELLQGGEISLAIKEGGHVVTKEEFQAAKSDAEKYLAASTDDTYKKRMNSAIAAAADDAPATASRAAGDFVGGWHGDENIENGQLIMYLDGEAIDFTKAGTYTGTQFIFDQTCLIDRCDEPGNNVMRHRQYMLIDSNGLRNDQTVEFLTNDFVPDEAQTYLQMCTFNRQNFSLEKEERVKPENYICSNLNMLDANGKVLSNHDLSNHQVADKTKTVGASVENRYVEYLGNPNNAGKGLYGRVGFVIDDHSFQPSNIKISVRETQGDNKWYASFKSYNGTTVPKGKIWNISDYYYFDYAPTDYVAATAE